jgi:hypothetical protein
MQYVILEKNDFTALTVNSLKTCIPDVEYKVIVKNDKSALEQSLQDCNDLTFVIASGVVLELKKGDLPPEEKLRKYHIAASKQAVFAEYQNKAHHYQLIGSGLHGGVVDLSLFIINPKMWENKTDCKLSDKKVLNMPRYMNHRPDPTLGTCMGGYEILKYASLGEDCSVFNYVEHLEFENADVRESMGYCFDRLLPYTDGLPSHSKNVVEALAKKSITRAAKLRKCLHELKQKAVD